MRDATEDRVREIEAFWLDWRFHELREDGTHDEDGHRISVLRAAMREFAHDLDASGVHGFRCYPLAAVAEACVLVERWRCGVDDPPLSREVRIEVRGEADATVVAVDMTGEARPAALGPGWELAYEREHETAAAHLLEMADRAEAEGHHEEAARLEIDAGLVEWEAERSREERQA